MPSQAAWAPRASTAATPRASPIPPAAITGTGATASTTAGTSGSVATVPHTCPPASQPCATITSTPDADRPPGLLGGADRVQDDSPGVVHALDVAAGIPHMNETIRNPAVQGLVQATVVIFGENEVAAERPRGQRRRLTNDRSDVIGPRQRQHAERAGIRDRRGQLGNRGHGCLDDRLLDPEQLAYRRGHCLRPFVVPGHTYTMSASTRTRRSQPWNFE